MIIGFKPNSRQREENIDGNEIWNSKWSFQLFERPPPVIIPDNTTLLPPLFETPWFPPRHSMTPIHHCDTETIPPKTHNLSKRCLDVIEHTHHSEIVFSIVRGRSSLSTSSWQFLIYDDQRWREHSPPRSGGRGGAGPSSIASCLIMTSVDQCLMR